MYPSHRIDDDDDDDDDDDAEGHTIFLIVPMISW